MPVAYGDLTKLATAMQGAGEQMDMVVARLLRTTAAEIQTEAQQFAPKRTGALAASITAHFPNANTAIIGPEVKYGPYQELGTRGPYPIYPRKPGGYLVFKVEGKTVFARKVTHPGLKAKPYMRPATQDVIGKLVREVGHDGVQLALAQNVNG